MTGPRGLLANQDVHFILVRRARGWNILFAEQRWKAVRVDLFDGCSSHQGVNGRYHQQGDCEVRNFSPAYVALTGMEGPMAMALCPGPVSSSGGVVCLAYCLRAVSAGTCSPRVKKEAR